MIGLAISPGATLGALLISPLLPIVKRQKGAFPPFGRIFSVFGTGGGQIPPSSCRERRPESIGMRRIGGPDVAFGLVFAKPAYRAAVLKKLRERHSLRAVVALELQAVANCESDVYS
jgi:hypothetical protein